MSAKKKCCCTTSVGPCACSAGAPWVAGRSTSVRLNVAFTGVTPTAPTLGWGCVNNDTGSAPRWYGVDTFEPNYPGFCTGTTPTADQICAWTTQIYNEGNTWRTGGASQDSTSDPFPRNQAACGFSADYVFGDGPWALPDFGTPDTTTTVGRVAVSGFYNASLNQTTIDVLCSTTFSEASVDYDVHTRAPFTNDCDDIDGGTVPRHLNNIVYGTGSSGVNLKSFTWFKHSVTFSGKLCPNASYVLTDQNPAHVPQFVNCGLGIAGRIRVATGGVCTLTLIDA